MNLELASNDRFFATGLTSCLLVLALGCVRTSTPTTLGHPSADSFVRSSALPSEHRSSTVIHGVVHTISSPPAEYLRCNADADAAVEADTTQRPNAYELARVDGAHPKLARVWCLHRRDDGYAVEVVRNAIVIGYRRHPMLHSGRSFIFEDIPLFTEDLDALEAALRQLTETPSRRR